MLRGNGSKIFHFLQADMSGDDMAAASDTTPTSKRKKKTSAKQQYGENYQLKVIILRHKCCMYINCEY